MRKILSALLVLMLLLSLCACGSDDSQVTEGSTDSSQTTTGGTEGTGSTESTGGTEGTTGTTLPPADQPTTAPTDDPTTPPTQPSTEAPTTPPATECSHSWKDATCTVPKTCTKCGATEGNAAEHSWSDATCTAAKTCTKCGATEGDAAGHNWSNATCIAPKTCTKCGATEGSTAGHNYSDGACTVCGAEDPNVPFTGNVWTANFVRAGSSEEGEVLSFYSLNPTDFQGYTHKEYYSNENYSFMYYDSITHDGKTYYDFWMSSEMNGIEWEDNGDTVKVVFAYNEPATELVLTRTSEAQFTVASSTDAENIPVGTAFSLVQED